LSGAPDERTLLSLRRSYTPHVTGKRAPAKHFKVLPEPIRLEDTIASVEVRDAPDPEAGRDTERDFLLRYN
jgi:hypothetical protein